MGANIATVGGNGSNLAYANSGTTAVNFKLTNYGDSKDAENTGKATSDNPEGNGTPQELSAHHDSGQQVQEDANPLPMGGINLLRQGIPMQRGFVFAQSQQDQETSQSDQTSKGQSGTSATDQASGASDAPGGKDGSAQTGAPKKQSVLDLGYTGGAKFMATTGRYQDWRTPPANANLTPGISFPQLNGRFSLIGHAKPTLDLSSYVRFTSNNYPGFVAADSSGLAVGMRMDVNQKGGMFYNAYVERLLTNDSPNPFNKGKILYTSWDVAGTFGKRFTIGKDTKVEVSNNAWLRDTKRFGFSRFADTVKVGIERPGPWKNWSVYGSAEETLTRFWETKRTDWTFRGVGGLKRKDLWHKGLTFSAECGIVARGSNQPRQFNAFACSAGFEYGGKTPLVQTEVDPNPTSRK